MDLADYASMIGLLVEKTGMSGSQLGNSLKSIITRTTKAGKIMGIDEGDISKAEESLRGIGIEVRKTDGEFKAFNDTMSELSKKWDTLSDVEKANVSFNLAGTRQINVIQSLLRNWTDYEDLVSKANNSSGKTIENQDKYVESLSGHLGELSAVGQSVWNNVLNSEELKSGVDLLIGLVSGVDKLTSAFGGFNTVVSGIALYNFIKNFQQLKSAGAAVTALKELNMAVSTGTTNYSSLAAILKTVDTQTKISIVSQAALSKEQKMMALNTAGVSAKEIEAAVSTGVLTTAQTTAKVSTIGFSTALKGLWATMLANPLLAVGMAITAGFSAWNAYKQSVEETRQATQEAASVFVDTTKSVDEYAEKYKKLHDELTNANTTEERQHEIKTDLLSLQKELNEKYGDEYGRINLVTEAYKDQTEAILAMNSAAAKNYLLENREGIESATRKMEQQRTYSLGSTGYMSNDYAKQMYDIVSQYADKGVNLEQFNAGSETGYKITFTGDAEQADKVIHDLANQMQDLQDKFKGNNFVESFLDNSANALKENNKVLDDYQEIYDNSLMAQIASDDQLSEGYTKAKTAVNQYNEAVASGDESKIEEARNGLNDVKNSIDLTSDDWKRYGGIMTTVFGQASTGLYDFRDAITTNQDGIKDLINDLSGLSKEDLLSMADDGQIDNFDKLVEAGKKYGLTAEDVITVLQKLKLVQDEVAESGTEAFAPISKQDLIANINSLSTGFESLDKIMNSMSDKNPFDYALLDDKNFKDTFSGLGDEYAKFIETISSSPNDIKSAKSAFDDLVTTWIDNSGVLTGLTEDNSNLAVSMLKNMGVANAEEVVSTRLAITQEHLAAQKAYTVDMSDALSNATASEIPNLIDEATQSDIAKVALAGLAIEKANVNGTALDTSGDIENIISLTGVVGSANRALKALNALKSGNLGHGVGSEADYNSLVSAAQKEVDDAIKEASEYKGKGTSTNVVYGGGTKTNKNSSDSSSKAKEETKKNIDWIERELKLLSDKRSELMEKASDDTINYLGITNEEFALAKELFNNTTGNISDNATELANIAKSAGISLSDLYTLITNGNPGESKENYLAQILKIDDEKILPETEAAVERYKQIYEDAASEISAQYKAKIELGGNDIETFTGDDVEKIQTTIDAYDQYLEMVKQLEEAKKANKETKRAKYDNNIASYEKENEQLEKTNSLIEAQISYYKSLGKVIDASFYKKLINNTGTEISNTQGEISEMKAKLKDSSYGKDSKEYTDLKNDIKSAEASLYALEQSQEEYNNTLAEMPIDNLSTLISMYNDITSAIENWGAVQTATGQKLNSEYYQTLISNGSTIIDQYQEQADLIQDTMDEYDEGSDRWNELYSQLQSINSEMSSMIKNLAEWNEELLNMPLESIESYSSSMQKVIDGLSSVQSEYDTVISAVTGAIKDQINVLEDEREAAEDAAQAGIDALQNKLDLLEKQNEKLKLQTTLEQALYDLESATTQKTELTIRNGEQVYEQNTDDYRSALEAVADAQSAIEKNDLQTQIDDAQDALDDLTDSYQDQIDALQEISDKWSEISEKITQAQNEATATSILGEGWINKILTGNDSELYSTFTALYQTNADQLKAYQEQADTTDSIYSLLEDYINSYKDGTITYEQAMSGINNLLSQMNDSLSAVGNLQNIYDYLGRVNNTDANSDSILNGIKDGLSTAADELLLSLEQYNKNAGTISEYTSSWQELTDDVSEMLDVVKEVRDNLEEAVDDAESDTDSESGDPFRPGSSGYVDSGPGVYADGIENGLVGSSSSSDAGKMIKYLTTEKLSGGEVPVIAHEGEAILNANQQAQLLKNIRSMQNYVSIIPDFSSSLNNLAVRKPSASIAVNLSYGDLSFPNVRNIDNAIEEFARLSEQAIIQNLSKYK